MILHKELSMAEFSIMGVYLWNMLDNAACVVTHVNDRLVVHSREFKRTISNNESQCRDNLIYLDFDYAAILYYFLHTVLVSCHLAIVQFTKKTQECASQVGYTRLMKASITTDTLCLARGRSRSTGPTKYMS